MRIIFIILAVCFLVMLVECRPHQNQQNLEFMELNSPSDQTLIRHHREKRTARGKKIKKARKNRKTWNDLNDADLYRYIQLRTLFRYVAYHPAEEE